MKLISLLIGIIILVSCKKETIRLNSKSIVNVENRSASLMVSDSVLYFENALIYEVHQNGEKEELWFYVNEQKNQILFVPKDDMIQAVVSFSNGDYQIYGTQENGTKVILTQNIEAVVVNDIDDNLLISNQQSITINQKNIQQNDIICQGFIMKYLKIEGSETLFATQEIPINAWQLYGFSRLDGDARVSSDFDYLNVFKQKQLITHVYKPELKLRLLNYGPNPYEFHVSEYQ